MKKLKHTEQSGKIKRTKHQADMKKESRRSTHPSFFTSAKKKKKIPSYQKSQRTHQFIQRIQPKKNNKIKIFKKKNQAKQESSILKAKKGQKRQSKQKRTKFENQASTSLKGKKTQRTRIFTHKRFT